ncbi:hypothetical protein BDV10DRAFT_171352 [Aspergillus recurvatus]
MAYLVLGFYLLATFFLILAVLWQHIASVAHAAATQLIFHGAVQIKIGAAAVGLGWGAIGVTVWWSSRFRLLFWT